ncbi:group II intron maturase-specific domain-containing protein [Streptomyces mirabilis]|uniref:group II intron maturase-specific domain-containing protein n=1 Tax=Streptomyces mirabilis TaxID=68239 RepID=UPI00292D3671|nr:group II intron maturase-specific domain-containing protein [Streptomyces mirabilis]
MSRLVAIRNPCLWPVVFLGTEVSAGEPLPQDKTRIVHAESGFDFLGFNVRRYHGKLLIKPSRAAQRQIRERLSTEMVALRGANAGAVLKKINPIVRGWSAYYRTVVSSEIFTALDNHMWKLAYKWAEHSHPNKPKHWISDKYFGRFNKSRNDWWVFGDRDSGAYLLKFSWTRIVRHQLVKGKASADDPHWNPIGLSVAANGPLYQSML